jgi:elongation factor P hydroxylase
MQHQYTDLIALFAQCFEQTWQTRLVKGEAEPLYLPANTTQPLHHIIFAHGYFSSALHEIAHWLLAGPARRQQVDYGYWYMPDGRTAEQQSLFQQVEVKPQAMEWILSQAAGHCFHVSLDNLQGTNDEVLSFKQAIYQQVLTYCEQGLPARAAKFRQALSTFYDKPKVLDAEQFSLSSL